MVLPLILMSCSLFSLYNSQTDPFVSHTMLFSASNALMVFHVIRSNSQNPDGTHRVIPVLLPPTVLTYFLLLSLLLESRYLGCEEREDRGMNHNDRQRV